MCMVKFGHIMLSCMQMKMLDPCIFFPLKMHIYDRSLGSCGNDKQGGMIPKDNSPTPIPRSHECGASDGNTSSASAIEGNYDSGFVVLKAQHGLKNFSKRTKMSNVSENGSKGSHLSSLNLLASLASMTTVQLLLAGPMVALEQRAAQEPLVARVMNGGLHSMLQQMGRSVSRGPTASMVTAGIIATQTLAAVAHQIGCHPHHHRGVHECTNTRRPDWHLIPLVFLLDARFLWAVELQKEEQI
ncbi:uncharacterized protein LOC103700489 isoform X2 [Phoenix dactylifera]|uniref:Uncharacterized protein LOC103700489 isoform X2 n=1 Tax=Phoenix dactylifera TaxID=42345 RepID=A0A8B8ZGD9_PHODC|nr:uncharacterized protein LOC103700489 isoform X2 [Phoenix dactylifera]